MKRRFYALMLVVAMFATTLVGCGQQASSGSDENMSTEQKAEESIDADGTFEIKYIFEMENGVEYAKEGNRIDLCLFDNNDNEIYNSTLFNDVTTEELFAQFENVVTDEMVSNFIDEHYAATLDVWKEGQIPEDIYKMDEYPQIINLNLGNANFNLNIELEECFIRTFSCEAANSDKLIYDYVLVFDDKYAKTLNGICYKLTGTYNCDIDISKLALNGQTNENIVASNDPVQEPIEETIPTPEEVVNEENNSNLFAYSSTFVFPDDMEGFTRKFLNENYPEWSINETHYLDINGNEMNFSWEGPAGLGESAGTNSNTLNLKEKSDTYEIRAWHGGSMTMKDIELALEADSTVWTSTTSTYCSLPENGYYNVERIENTLIITYELIDNNSGKIGYARFLANADIGEIYCFMYLETPEMFDDTRVMNVINSFDFWDYVPEQ